MTLVPYPHQAKMIEEAREAIKAHDGVLIQSPTGSGKTAIGTLITQSANARGRRVVFTVHRDFLIDQTYEAFSKVGLDVTIMAAGTKPRPGALAIVASIDTLRRRVETLDKCDLIIVDECHHLAAAGWEFVFNHLRGHGAKAIGLTATPWRLTGEGLRQFFSYMVRGPSVRWLIDNNFLSDYTAFAPSTPNLSGVHTKMGDFVKSELEAAMDKAAITGDAVQHYLRLAAGKRAVAFCCTVKHSLHVTEQFQAAGVPSRHIDHHTPKAERKEIIAAFRAGEVRLLSSVNIFGEGFDIPSIEAAILLRPTKSLSLHLQQIGRALRTFDGKGKALILDHAGNLMRPGLGLPDTDYEWSLDGGKKKKKNASLPIKQCEECFFVYTPPVATCPNCGHVHQVLDRNPEQRDGELQEITPEMRKLLVDQQRKEVREARTLDQLKALGQQRGYHWRWAEQIFEARERAQRLKAENQARAYGR